MKRYIPIAALLLAACSMQPDPKEVEAVRDFVVANELEEVDSARTYGELQFKYVNDYFVILPLRRGDYLVEFKTRCSALREQTFRPDMVDVRRDNNVVRARFDTLRGCRMSKIYEITREQREEIEQLGDAPGDEVYLDDDEE